MKTGAGRILDDRQPRPRRLDVEAHVAVLVGAGAGPVVAGEHARDQSRLDHLGGERIGQLQVSDSLHLAQHRADPAAVVATEVAPHPLSEVGGLADVEDLVAVAAEQIDTRGARELGGHRQLRRLRMAGQLGECEQVVDAEHTEAGRTFDQQVQQVGGGERIVEGAMSGLVVEPESVGERGQPVVGHLVAQQPTGEGGGVDDGGAVVGALVAGEGGAQESEIERDVVADEHGVAQEVDQRAEDGLDARRVAHDGVAQPCEHRDLGRDRPARVDQRVKGAEALAAADLDHADLGDHVVVPAAARGLEVEHAERGVAEGDAPLVEQVVEAALSQHPSRHGSRSNHERTFAVKNTRSISL